MKSRRVVDLRRRKPGGALRAMRPLALRGSSTRRSPLRARRRRTKAIIMLALLALLVIAAFGVSWASYLPQISIERVVVEGARAERVRLVRAFAETKLHDGSAGFLSPTNIALYPRERIEEAVREFFPRIKSARITRGSLLATTAVLTVEERAAYARWCARGVEGEDACFAMDDEGFIFAPANTAAAFAISHVFRGDVATSSPIGKHYIPGSFPALRVLLERLGQAGFAATETVIEEGGDFSIILARGFALRAAFGGNVNDVVKNLQLVLSSDALRDRESELEYVDLRFGNRVYYKLRGEEQQTAE